MIFLYYTGTSALIIYFQQPENTEIWWSYVQMMPRPNFNSPERSLDSWTTILTFTLRIHQAPFRSVNFTLIQIWILSQNVSLSLSLLFFQISGDSLFPWDGLHNPCNRIFQHSHSFGKFLIQINVIRGCMRIMLTFAYMIIYYPFSNDQITP